MSANATLKQDVSVVGLRKYPEDANTMLASFKSKTPTSNMEVRGYQGKIETVGVDDFLGTFWSRKKCSAAGTVDRIFKPSNYFKIIPED